MSFILFKRPSRNPQLNYIYVPDNFGCCGYSDRFVASSDPYKFLKTEPYVSDRLCQETTRVSQFPMAILSSEVLCLVELEIFK